MDFKELSEQFIQLNNNLNSVLNDENQKSFNLYNDTLQSLNDNKNNYHLELNKLEDNLKIIKEERIQKIQQFKQKVEDTSNELIKKVKEYKLTHVASNDKEEMFKQKDKKLASSKNEKKKRMNELTQKISALDKEAIQIIKENSLLNEEEEKNLKVKVFDLKKRMEYEIQKLNYDNTKQYDELQKKLLETNNHNEIHLINKQIKEIRKVGIIEQAKLQHSFNNRLKEAEINLINYTLEYKKKNEILRNEYSLEIEKYKNQKDILNHELNKSINLYDFEVYRKTNKINNDYLIEANNIKNDYNKKIEEIHNKRINYEIDLDKLQYDEVIALQEKIYNQNNIQSNLYHNIIELNNESITIELNNIENFIITMIQNINKTIIQYIENYYNSLYQRELYFFTTLSSFSFSFSQIEGFKYDKYKDDIYKVYEEFKSNQESKFQRIIKKLEDSTNIIIKQFSDYINVYRDYKLNEYNSLKEYNKMIDSIIEKSFKDALEYNKNEYNQYMNATEETKKSLMNECKKNDNECLLEKKDIDNQYDQEIKTLNNKIVEFNVKKQNELNKIESDYKVRINQIKNTISSLEKKYRNDIKKNEFEINKKYQKLNAEVEQEKKTKLDLL